MRRRWLWLLPRVPPPIGMAPTRHPVRVAHRQPIQVAKADEKRANTPVKAVTENSSIATVAENKATQTVKTAAAEPTIDASTAKVGCMKYFPSVGMTRTVPCE